MKTPKVSLVGWALPLLLLLWSVQAVAGANGGSPFAVEEGLDVVTFTDVAAGLPGVSASAAAWGDYDNDGDLDILLTGCGGGLTARVYRNDAGTFTDVGAGLPGVCGSAVAWGDYDHDGDLDILLTGYTSPGYIARVYRNDAGTFTDIVAGLPGVLKGSVAWGDYDHDGDLDILLTGSGIARVYRNDAGTFTDIVAGLPGVGYSSVAWGDYDNYRDLDILFTGSAGSERIARVYHNDAGTFIDISAELPGVNDGSVAWGDYDSDGDLDILLTGRDAEANCVAGVYRNGAFDDIGAGLPGVYESSVAWGDYDNDGDLDILLTGRDAEAETIAGVYRNDAGTFDDIGAGLPGVYISSAAWGDYDNDGDLDILLTGLAGSGQIARVYRSDGAPANAPPTAPSGLSASVVGDQATLSWSASTDAETPAAGLSYNLRVGTTPGGSEVSSAMAEGASGYRRVVGLGNAQQRTSWTLTLLPGSYYWSVQAVDGAWAGSPFAAEQGFNSTTAVGEETPRELKFTLAGASPVVGSAQFRLGLPARAHVELAIHDVAGRRVASLVSGDLEAGYHTASWSSGADGGRRAAGVYFARLTVGGRVFTRRVVALR